MGQIALHEMRTNMRAYVFWVVICLLVLTVSAVAQNTSPPLMGLPELGLKVAQVPAGQYIFNNQQDWTEFWARYSDQPAPLVDFSGWQVVAIFLGSRPNPGYNVEVQGYTIQDTEMIVRYHEWVPAPGAMYAQVIVYPADIVALPTSRTVTFTRTSGPHGLMEPGPRNLPYTTVNASDLSAQTPEQFLAITTATHWQQFWNRYGKGAVPTVQFTHGQMVIGVVGWRSQGGVTISQVQRAGDRIIVTLGPGGKACPTSTGERSVLLIVPYVSRVEYQMLPFCR